MANLYQTTIRVRKFIIGFLVFAILLLTYDTFSSFSTQTEVAFNDAARFYMTPDQGFGSLPVPAISGIDLDTDNNASFGLESVHAEFPDVAYVYRVEKPTQKLGSFENALNVAKILGFSENNYNQSGDTLSWQDATGTKTLTYHQIDQTWRMQTEYINNPNALARKSIEENPNSYVSRAISALNSMRFNTLGLTTGRSEVIYSRISPDGSFQETEEPSEAEYVYVDVFRELDFADLKPIAEQPALQTGQVRPEAKDAIVYKDDPRQGQFRVVVSNDMSNLTRDIFEIYFNNFEYGEKTPYLIISPDEAWTKVQRGEGSLVFLQQQGENYLNEIVPLNVQRFIADARRTEIGYFEPDVWDGFVYPIYVFRGRAELENGRQASFIFFVDAIKRLE